MIANVVQTTTPYLQHANVRDHGQLYNVHIDLYKIGRYDMI